MCPSAAGVLIRRRRHLVCRCCRFTGQCKVSECATHRSIGSETRISSRGRWITLQDMRMLILRVIVRVLNVRVGVEKFHLVY